MPRFSFQIDFDHPSPDRTLYFPHRPGRGAREDAVTDYSGVEGWYPLEKNSRHSIRWRGWVGTFIAEHLGYLENDKRAWHIDDWPPGYRLWLKERRKQSRNNRADVYLLGFGGRSRFESPQEFAFHAVWLYADEYHDSFPCECTLDTGRPQGEINAIWLQPEGPRLPIRAGSRSRAAGGGGSGGGSRGRGRDVDMGAGDDEPRSDIFDPGPKLVHWIPSKRSLLDGPVDDSEQSESPSRERGRVRSLLPFKNMELVWIKIPPIPAASSDDSMNLWPALVTDGRSTGSAGAHQYEVRLLGVDSTRTVPEALVFPYQVKPLLRPSRSTASASRSLPGNVTSASQLPHFHPLPIPSNSAAAADALERTYSNAIGPFKLALTVARDIAVQFCLMGQHVGDTQDPSSPKLYRWAWMGPQRIEPGDMVRLVPTREKLAELGVSTMELLEESDGAGQACLFVQIVNIRLNEEGKAGFGGHLFELVPGRGGGQVEAAGLATLPLPPPGHTFRLLTSPTSPIFFELLWIAGRYEHLTFHSDTHRNFIENNLLGKQHLTYWDIQYRRGKELSQTVKHILSLTGLGPGAWNAITAKPVTVTGRQAGIQHAVKGARRLYFGDEEDDVTSGSENLSDDE